MKFLSHRVSAESLALFVKKCFPAIFGSHLEVLCKTQNAFISKMTQDRVIWNKFLAQRVPSESSDRIKQKLLFCCFCSHLDFLHKAEKKIISTIV